MNPDLIPRLRLINVRLLQKSNDALAFDATGELIDVMGGSIPNAPDVTVGFGAVSADSVPDALEEGFPELVDNLPEGASFWIHTEDGASTANWLMVLSKNRVQLYGIQPLDVSALNIDGLSLQDSMLKISLDLYAGVVSNLNASIKGKITFTQKFGDYFEVKTSPKFSMNLVVEDATVSPEIISNPSKLLKSAFRGKFEFDGAGATNATRARFRVGDFLDIELTELLITASVSSQRDSTVVLVEQFVFDVQSPQIKVAGVTITDLKTNGAFNGTTKEISFNGSSRVELPALFTGISDSPLAGINSAFLFKHHPGAPASGRTPAQPQKTSIKLNLDGLTLAPSVNVLGLSSADLSAILVYDGDDWNFACEAQACQSWGQIARNFSRSIPLPDIDGAPDLLGKLIIFVLDDGTKGTVRIDCRLLAPGSNRPFEGKMGPLPIILGAPTLSFETEFNNSTIVGWHLLGETRVDTMAWLENVLPLRSTFCKIEAGDGGFAFLAEGDLPAISIPPFSSGAEPINLIELKKIYIRIDNQLVVEGTAEILSSFDPAEFADSMGMEGEGWKNLAAFLGDSLTNLSGGATVRIAADLSDAGSDDVKTKVDVSLKPDHPGFAFSDIIPPQAPTEGQVRPTGEVFHFRINEILFGAVFGGETRLDLAVDFECTVFEGTRPVSARAELRLVNGKPEISIIAGAPEPIRIAIPQIPMEFPDKAIDNIFKTYKFDSNLKPQLEEVKKTLETIFGNPATQELMVFEISGLGLRITDEGPAVSGAARLLKLPGFLDGTLANLKLGLGSSLNDIHIFIENAGEDPLFSIPVGGPKNLLHLYLAQFKLAYAWSSNAFSLSLDGKVETTPEELLEAKLDGGSGVAMPKGVRFKGKAGVTATAPPIPIPEGLVTFLPEASNQDDTAYDEMGLQAYLCTSEDRLATLFFRQSSFSPTYFFLSPGLVGDGGVVIGGPDPKKIKTYEGYQDALVNRSMDGVKLASGNLTNADIEKSFYIAAWAEEAMIVFLPISIGAVLNPLALVPPFINPMPPFWLMPPAFMGDIFVKRMSIAVNIPDLVFFSLNFQRPKPEIPLAALLEMAALVLSGFEKPIPEGSALSKVMYVQLSGKFKLPFLGQVEDGLDFDVSVNVVDIINGIITTAHFLTDAFQNGVETAQTLMEKFVNDPNALIQMIPYEKRTIEFEKDAKHTVLGFTFSGSVYLLTPEELRKELLLFHENKRLKEKNLHGTKDKPPIPGTGVASTGEPSLVDERTFKGKFVKELKNFQNKNDQVLNNYVDSIIAAADKARSGKLGILDKTRRDNYTEFASQIIEKLGTGNISLKTILSDVGLSSYENEIKDILKTPGLSTAKKVKQIVELIIKKKRVSYIEGFPGKPVSDVSIGAATAIYESVADKVINCITKPAGPPGSSKKSPWISRDDRLKWYQKYFNYGTPQKKVGDVTSRIEDAISETKDSALAKKEITKILRKEFSFRYCSSLDKLAFDTKGVKTKASEKLFVAPNVQQKKLWDTRLFDGKKLGGVIRKICSCENDNPDHTVCDVDGYEIRSVQEINPPSGQNRFTRRIPTAYTRFDVRLMGGRYRLLVFEDASSQSPTSAEVLPAWLTDDLPEIPDKVDKIRARLEVHERRKDRPATSEEIEKAHGEVFEEDDRLYLTSILARPEYRIKDEGGVHGVMYYGDLLKSPGAAAEYHITDKPILLAGATLDLWGNEISLAGMISGTNAFLTGYHKITIIPGNVIQGIDDALSLEIEGEFALIAGQLWGSDLGKGLSLDSFSFNGKAVFKNDGKVVFEGSASGSISMGNKIPELQLTVDVHIHNTWYVKVADIQVAKLVVPDANANVCLVIDQNGFSFSSEVAVNLDFYIGVPKMIEVVDTPAIRVCVDYFDILAWKWKKACVTTPPVLIEVPDPTQPPDWKEHGNFNGYVGLTVTNGLLDMSLSATSLPVIGDVHIPIFGFNAV